ncbi:MAG: hypothetical protein AAGN66_08195 [Acidobacteriota bacterium]
MKPNVALSYSAVLRPMVAFLGLGLLAAVAAAEPTVIATTTSDLPGNVTRTEVLVQDGASPLDRFKISRLAKDGPHLGDAILLLPSLGVDMVSYEQPAPRRGFGSSIAGFFALRGYDVYGYSSRLEGIPAGTCEAGVLDCSVMASWNLQRVVDDVAFVRAFIEEQNPGVRVFVGGLSLGAISTFAVLDADPSSYAGAFVWEGMLATPDPAVQALNQGYCAGLEAQLAAGILFDGVGANVLRKVTKLADASPASPNTNPLFPPFFTHQQAMVAALSLEAPGPVSMPLPGYIALAGDVTQGTFDFADQERLIENVSRFNDYTPNALVRDVSCSLAGVETSYVDNLGSFTGPVLAIGGGRGFGASMQDNLDLLGSTDVEFLLEPDFGHVDHLFSPQRRRLVERPILRWLRSH